MNQVVRLKPTFEAEVAESIAPADAKVRAAANSPKSLRTRARILNAALNLFVEIGYHEATNARIAEASKLTRGAMLYHFPDREALLEAVVPFIQEQRAKLLQAAAEQAPHTGDLIDHAIDSYWRLLSEPAFVAFAELENAARTDASVRERLVDAQAAFDRAEFGDDLSSVRHGADGARLQASRDLGRFLLEGLARARLSYDSEGRKDRLIAVVKRAAHILNRKGSLQDLWPEG
jgi:AcrR family transcriptional regulator